MVEAATVVGVVAGQTGAVPDAAVAQAAAKEEQRIALEKIIDQQIEVVSRMSLPEDKKSELISRLLSVKGNSAGALMLVINNLRTELPVKVADSIATVAANYYAMENFPEYAEYSPEGQAFIRKQLNFAMEKSETMRALAKDVEAISPEIREQAKQTIGQNFKDWKALKQDHVLMEHIGPGAAAMVDDFKLAQHPNFYEWMEKAKSGADQAQLLREVAAMAADQINIAGTVAKEILPHLDSKAQLAIKQEFGEPANMSKFIQTFNRISIEQRNDALYNFKKNGEDISKLSKEDQRIVYMMQLAVPIEQAQVSSAIIAISKNQDKSLLAELANGSLSVDNRAEKLEKIMSGQGILVTDRGVRDNLAEDMIRFIDQDPQAKQLIADGNFDALNKRFESHRTKEVSTGIIASALSFAEKAYSDIFVEGDTSPYLQKSFTPEQLVAKKEAWLSLEKQRFLEANTAPAGDEAPMTPEQTAAFLAEFKKKRDALAPDAPNALAANTPMEQGAAPASAQVAVAVVAPPPGMNSAAIAAACEACGALVSASVQGGNGPTLTSGVPPEGMQAVGTKPVADISGQAF